MRYVYYTHSPFPLFVFRDDFFRNSSPMKTSIDRWFPYLKTYIFDMLRSNILQAPQKHVAPNVAAKVDITSLTNRVRWLHQDPLTTRQKKNNAGYFKHVPLKNMVARIYTTVRFWHQRVKTPHVLAFFKLAILSRDDEKFAKPFFISQLLTRTCCGDRSIDRFYPRT